MLKAYRAYLEECKVAGVAPQPLSVSQHEQLMICLDHTAKDEVKSLMQLLSQVNDAQSASVCCYQNLPPIHQRMRHLLHKRVERASRWRKRWWYEKNR